MGALPEQVVSTSTPVLSLEAVPITAVERCMEEVIAGLGTGLCTEMALVHLAAGGKRLRARLALAALRALGGAPGDGVPWAAACELLHNASLIHDDLQDGDRVRRDRPALWTVYGADQAINAGDLMLMLSTEVIGGLDVADALKWRLASCVARHGASTARGQAEEMALRSLTQLDVASYLRAAAGKTAGLFGMPVEGAAMLAGHSDEDARRLARPFEVIGLAYQLIDDVVDLFGEKGRGERGADIREGKVSALVVSHLALHPADRVWLCGVLRRPREETTDAMVERCIDAFHRGGALASVLGRIHELAAEMDGPALDAEPALRAVGQALRDRLLAPLEAVGG